MKLFSFCLSVHPQDSLSPAGRSLKGNEACDEEGVSVDGGGWGAGVGFWSPFIKSGLSVVSPGFKVSHIWVSVNEWSEQRLQRGETHSLQHSSIIYFFFFWRTTTASHLENSSISNNTVLKNVKLLYKFLIEKKKNKLTVELFFFFFRNSTFFFLQHI